jgi:hypothetical protein
MGVESVIPLPDTIIPALCANLRGELTFMLSATTGEPGRRRAASVEVIVAVSALVPPSIVISCPALNPSTPETGIAVEPGFTAEAVKVPPDVPTSETSISSAFLSIPIVIF